MRCLQIVDSYSSAGGMERFIYDFSQLLASNDMETVVAAFEVQDAHSWGSFKVKTARIGESVTKWEKWVDDFSPDFIVWHTSPQSAPYAEKLSKSYRVVSTVHGVLCPSGSRLFRDRDEICHRTAGLGCYGRWYLRKCGSSASPIVATRAMQTHKQMMTALSSCYRIYAVSQAIENFLKIEGVYKEKIRIFDNTLGYLKDLPPLEKPRSAESVNILYVGRLVYAKGAQYLIRTVRILLDKGIAVKCIIAGDGWYADKLTELAMDLNLTEHVAFVGKIPGHEMNKWYSECDLVVVPSIWPDPSPLVVPEARMMGKPVVVFDSGGLPEWADIIDGIFVADHANAQSLADTIKFVLDNPGMHKKERTGQERVDLARDLSDMFALQ